MLQPVSHYFPWDTAEGALCGHPDAHLDTHSQAPTCAICAARLDADVRLEAAIEDAPLPLDAEEARTELDPVLNAGLPAPSPLAEELFHMARVLTACYALTLVEKRGRR